MSNEELRAQARTSAPQIKIAAGIWAAGMMIIAVVTIVGVVLAFLAGDYYSNSKAVRDAAEAGSGVLSQLSNIQATKAWLLLLEILGIATFLFGFAFANILANVRLRGAPTHQRWVRPAAPQSDVPGMVGNVYPILRGL